MPDFKIMKEDSVHFSFAARLDEVCDDMELPERGRAKALGALFGVSYQAAQKWLDGLSFPTTETVIDVATWADVNVNWLLRGSGAKREAPANATIVVAQAIEVMNEQDRLQVVEFIKFKLSRCEGPFARGERARYAAALEQVKAHGPLLGRRLK